MSQGGHIILAAVAAVAAACAFGVGVALQHRQVQLEGSQAPLRLLARLARRKMWLAGIGLAIAAYGCQAIALTFGPLALVAPIVATDLLFALPIAAAWARRPMRRRDWAGCALVGGSVAVFVTSSPQSSGRSDAPARDWIIAFTLVALVAGAAAAVSMVSHSTARAALLSLAAGVLFGMTAAVTLSLTRLRFGDMATLLSHWQPYAVVILGISSLLLSATAFKAGPLKASLPIMDTVEPVSGVLIGTAVFGERLATSPSGLTLQLAAAVVAVTGIIMLGRSRLALGLSPGDPGGPVRAAAVPVPHARPAPEAQPSRRDFAHPEDRARAQDRQPNPAHRGLLGLLHPAYDEHVTVSSFRLRVPGNLRTIG